MQLGLIITDRRHAVHATGLLARATGRGWDVRCFLTDSGVGLLADEAFLAQAQTRPLSVAACRHSIDELMPGCNIEGLKPFVVIGSQFQGAKLAQSAQALLVL